MNPWERDWSTPTPQRAPELKPWERDWSAPEAAPGPEAEDRSFLEGLGDAGAGALKTTLALGEGATRLGDMLPSPVRLVAGLGGAFEKPEIGDSRGILQRASDASRSVRTPGTFVADGLADAGEWAEELKSQNIRDRTDLPAQQRALAAAEREREYRASAPERLRAEIDRAEQGGLLTAAGVYLSNPGLFFDALTEQGRQGLDFAADLIADPGVAAQTAAEQLPNFIPGLAAARGVGKASLAAGATQAAANKAATKAGLVVGGLQESGGALSAADAQFENLSEADLLALPRTQELVDAGLSLPDIRRLYGAQAGALAAPLAFGASYGLGKVTGGGKVEALISGGARREAAQTAAQAAGRVVGNTLVETGSEALQEAGVQVAGNVGTASVDPTQSLLEGTGEAAAMGGLMGATLAGPATAVREGAGYLSNRRSGGANFDQFVNSLAPTEIDGGAALIAPDGVTSFASKQDALKSWARATPEERVAWSTPADELADVAAPDSAPEAPEVAAAAPSISAESLLGEVDDPEVRSLVESALADAQQAKLKKQADAETAERMRGQRGTLVAALEKSTDEDVSNALRARISGFDKKLKALEPAVAKPEAAVPAVAPQQATEPKVPKIETAEDIEVGQRRDLLKMLRSTGIDIGERTDITREQPRKAARMAPGLFRKGGRTIDDVATDLYNAGYISETDFNDVDGGIQAARDLIYNAITKSEPVLSIEARDRWIALRNDEAMTAQDAADEVGIDAVDALALTGRDLSGDSKPDVIDYALVEQANEADEAAVEMAARQFENDDAGFMRAVQEIVDGRAEAARQADEVAASGAGREADARGSGQAVATGDPAAAQTAVSQGPDTGAFSLALQTEGSRQQGEARVAQAESQQQAQRQQAEMRAQSEREAGDFTLTGSDRPADVGTARGQTDIFATDTYVGSNAETRVAAASTAPENRKADGVESDGRVSDPGKLPFDAIVETADGRKFAVSGGRFGRLRGQPARADGSFEMSADATVDFATDDMAVDKFPSALKDPVFYRGERVGQKSESTPAAQFTRPQIDDATERAVQKVRILVAGKEVKDLRSATGVKRLTRRSELEAEAVRQAQENPLAVADALGIDLAPEVRAPLEQLYGQAPNTPAPAVADAQAGRLDDFGEKLGGARKDESPSLDREITDADIAAQPLSKIWPKSEIDAVEDKFVAALLTAARDEIPTKPRKGYKLTRWVQTVQQMRGMARTVQAVGRGKIDDLIKETPSLGNWYSKVRLMEAIDREQWPRIGGVVEAPDAYTYIDGERVNQPAVIVDIDGRKSWFQGFGDLEGALPRIREKLAGTEPATSKMQFEVRIRRKDGKVFINKKGDSAQRALREFDNPKQARAFINDNYDDLVAEWEGVKDRDNVRKSDVRRSENRPRTGADRRNGRDADEAMFSEAFGFRGVEFGNWLQQGTGQKDRQGMLNEVYDALMDLADVVGVPPRAMSLGGTLGLGLGSRGKGGKAAAHFEPDTLVINLTKTKGAGSLAHEWFHALDNYFARKRDGGESFQGTNFITYKPEPLMVRKDRSRLFPPMTRGQMLAKRKALGDQTDNFNDDKWERDPSAPQGVRPEVEERFADLVEALNDSPMAARARLLDSDKKAYWSQIIERGARSFENYVISKMMEKGYQNDFLANVVALEAFTRDKGRYPYLMPEEVAPVAQAFDALFDTIETRQDGDNVVLFSRDGQSATTDANRPDAPEWERSQVEKLNDILARQAGQDVPLRAVEAPTAMRDLSQTMETLLGRKAVFFESSDPRAPAGVYVSGGVLFVNADAKQPLRHVLGHEFTHSLEGPAAELHAILKARILEMAKDGAFPAYEARLEKVYQRDGLTKLSRAKVENEFVADVMGSIMSDPKVLFDLKQRMEPSAFQRLVNAINAWIDGLMARLRGDDMRQSDFAKRTMRDLDGIKALVGDVLQATAEGQLRPADGDAMPAFSGEGQTAGETFYSALTQNVEAFKQPKASPQMWKGIITNLSQKGVKKEEVDWSGVMEWLDQQQGPVTKEALTEFLRENEVQVEETVLGGMSGEQKDVFDKYEPRLQKLRDLIRAPDTRDESRELAIDLLETRTAERDREMARYPGNADTRYTGYQTPGGENYRELLLTLPTKPRSENDAGAMFYDRFARRGGDPGWADLSQEQRQSIIDDMPSEARKAPASGQYRSSHFDTPNVLAHVRFNERYDAEGKRVLFIEEVQSDWHQAGRRKGYANKPVAARFETREQAERANGRVGGRGVVEVDGRWSFIPNQSDRVPDAPFKQSWPMLAMKRMIRYASENGFDRIAWTTGEQQAARYDLSKQVQEINVFRDGEQFDVSVKDVNGRRNDLATGVSKEKLAETIGKELADKAADQDFRVWQTYSGLDLTIGGEGMKAFYDRELRNEVGKYVKKWGSKVEEATFFGELGDRFDGGDFDAHAIDITPQMRDAAMEGQPLFARDQTQAEPLPDAVIVAPLADAREPDYAAGKRGDADAAVRAVRRMLTGNALAQIDAPADSIVVGVSSLEVQGQNALPEAAASEIARRKGMRQDDNILQANRPQRTQLDGLDRIFAQPEFVGDVESGASYVIVDDTLTQGGTLASLAAHIERGGGRVAAVVSLTGKQYSRGMKPLGGTLSKLREKLGDAEQDFKRLQGYDFGGLTQSEARYLANYDAPERIRARIAAGLQAKGSTGSSSAVTQNPPDGGFSDSGDGVSFSRRGQAALDPYEQENRQLRESESALWKAAKNTAIRYLKPGGALDSKVNEANQVRQANLRGVGIEAQYKVQELERAVRADYGVAVDGLTPLQLVDIRNALAGKVGELPANTKQAVVGMRQYLDGQSREYIAILKKQIEDRLAADPDAAADNGLIETITGNLGQYVHRSYRVFDDPKWHKSVSTTTVNMARRYFEKEYIADGMSATDARKKADVTVNKILKTDTAYGDLGAFMAGSKLGAKDLSILVKRKTIAPEIRALMGEYADPRVNFTKSAAKMGALVTNTYFLDGVREMGLGVFLFDKDSRPANATVELAGKNSATYAPLNGLWATPETAKAFEDALGDHTPEGFMKWAIQANAMVNYGKTVLSPTTAMRNIQSSLFFTMANGHWNYASVTKAIAPVMARFSGDDAGRAAAQRYVEKLTRMGVLRDGVHAGDFHQYIKSSGLQKWAEGHTAFGKANAAAQAFYQFGDDFWKVIGWENEKAAQMRAGLSEADAEAEAAERIRNTYPTYSLAPKLVKDLSRSPLLGSFPTFSAEIIRTSYHMIRYMAKDIREGRANKNSAQLANGLRRAAGLAGVSSLFPAIQILSAAAAGIDDDDEEAIRLLAAPWSRNSNFLFLPRNEEGNARYVDLSFLDPYGMYKRPFNAALRDQPWEDAFLSATKDVLGPFFGSDIAIAGVGEALFNKKLSTGGPVYRPGEELSGIANHLRRTVQPGFVSSAERWYRALNDEKKASGTSEYSEAEEAAALVGWRSATLEPRTALYYRAFDFKDGKAGASSLYRRTLADPNTVSRRDIAEAREKAVELHTRAFEDMALVVSAAVKSGLAEPDARRALEGAGVSRSDTRDLLRGETPPFELSRQSRNNAKDNAKLVQGRPEFGAEIDARYRIARELDREAR